MGQRRRCSREKKRLKLSNELWTRSVKKRTLVGIIWGIHQKCGENDPKSDANLRRFFLLLEKMITGAFKTTLYFLLCLRLGNECSNGNKEKQRYPHLIPDEYSSGLIEIFPHIENAISLNTDRTSRTSKAVTSNSFLRRKETRKVKYCFPFFP